MLTKLIDDTLLVVTLLSSQLVTITVNPEPTTNGPTYYVDFASGNDGNSGTSTTAPWKHAPGDINATGAANITLHPGDTVVFKGGVVYQGTNTSQSGSRAVVAPNNSGSSGNPIALISGHVHSSAWGTGRAVLDGRGPGTDAAKFGVYVGSRNYITIEGLEIRNIGVPTVNAAGIDYERGTNAIVRNCVIHNINWSGSYVRGYGIENNDGANHLYEKNEVYNATDKLIETFGGGSATPGTDDASNAVIRYNVLHNASVHCVVLSSDNARFYDNVIWQCNDGTISNSPGPGFALKVDQGRNNTIFNNIAYNVNAGFGVLVGTGNLFAHNIVYGIGRNGGGTHGGNDEAALVFYNNDGSWGTGSGALSSNKFYNNIVYYVPNADAVDKPKLVFHDASGGSNNEVKNNIFLAISGDTSTTGTRIRVYTGRTSNYGNSYYSVSDWQSQFNTLMSGTGNVASGNLVVDPAFVGGTLGSLTNMPTGFTVTYGDVNTSAFHLSSGSPAETTGVTISGPANIDLRGNIRSAFWLGTYDSR